MVITSEEATKKGASTFLAFLPQCCKFIFVVLLHRLKRKNVLFAPLSFAASLKEPTTGSHNINILYKKTRPPSLLLLNNDTPLTFNYSNNGQLVCREFMACLIKLNPV